MRYISVLLVTVCFVISCNNQKNESKKTVITLEEYLKLQDDSLILVQMNVLTLLPPLKRKFDSLNILHEVNKLTIADYELLEKSTELEIKITKTRLEMLIIVQVGQKAANKMLKNVEIRKRLKEKKYAGTSI